MDTSEEPHTNDSQRNDEDMVVDSLDERFTTVRDGRSMDRANVPTPTHANSPTTAQDQSISQHIIDLVEKAVDTALANTVPRSVSRAIHQAIESALSDRTRDNHSGPHQSRTGARNTNEFIDPHGARPAAANDARSRSTEENDSGSDDDSDGLDDVRVRVQMPRRKTGKRDACTNKLHVGKTFLRLSVSVELD